MAKIFNLAEQQNTTKYLFVPNLGMKCSQPGNEMFPSWE